MYFNVTHSIVTRCSNCQMHRILTLTFFQVYKGLDIITNKVTAEERQQAQHHLLDFVDPLQDFHIQQFRDLAVSAIDQLHIKSKLPVVVGGTHYYIESVLWKVLVTGATKAAAASDSSSQSQLGLIKGLFSGGNDFRDTSCDRTGDASKNVQSSFNQTKTFYEKSCLPNHECEGMYNTPLSIENNPGGTVQPPTLLNYTREIADATEDLYEKLCSIDPDRAKMLHPKDRRKIIRLVWDESVLIYLSGAPTLKIVLVANVSFGWIKEPVMMQQSQKNCL